MPKSDSYINLDFLHKGKIHKVMVSVSQADIMAGIMVMTQELSKQMNLSTDEILEDIKLFIKKEEDDGS